MGWGQGTNGEGGKWLWFSELWNRKPDQDQENSARC